MNESIRVLGVMTGTSCDGLDASCVDFNGDGSRILWADSAPYPAALRKRVLQAQEPYTQASLLDWHKLDRDLGDWYAKALEQLIQKHSEKPDAIANHGQTLGHHPKERITIQMGNPYEIARKTRLTTVSGFREGDLAASGQGAPLLPLYHRLLADILGHSSGIAIHNIGGISNLTYVGPEGDILAFDTGPGNLWLDAATEKLTRGKQRFDRDGKLALKGEVDTGALQKLMRIPFLKKPAPKSTGRDDFPFEILLRASKKKGESLIATALWFTVESIAQAYEKNILSKGKPLQTIVVCGGGAKNPSLMEALTIRLPNIEVISSLDAGVDPSGIESQGFAYFGFRSLLGLSSSGVWTGAKGWVPPASIIPGENWSTLTERIKIIRDQIKTQ
ncbi:MAG: anhydro-N-acetylmuramic acid kinase [Bdellovibrionales bacterium]|nr:anhydro-N-acetylmuramic acid kinase [Bdellovibrionales bacterium]